MDKKLKCPKWGAKNESKADSIIKNSDICAKNAGATTRKNNAAIQSTLERIVNKIRSRAANVDKNQKK